MAILEQGEQFPIRPEHFDLDEVKHFWDAFGNHETEISARYIVRLAQKRGNWNPFTYADIEGIYNFYGYTKYTFNRLISEDWIALDREAQIYFITDKFVTKCFLSTLK